ncbi:PKD domain-containing protein [uncultured Abyssibacter sp.]|uniref:PKD domain-containing protein n=1 Tax=uncultured Abyssibacter sp. TaxID=2320202 RepID=UPI0032B1C5CD
MNIRSHLVLIVACTMLGGTAVAAEPASGTVSESAPTTEFASGPNVVSNPAYPDTGVCQAPVLACDDFALTVDVPSPLPENMSAGIRIRTVAPSSEDYDIYLLDADGNQINSSAAGGTPEEMFQTVDPGMSTFTVRVIPWLVTGSTADTTITLEFFESTGGGGDGGTGNDGRLPFDPTAPRYSTYVSPPNEGNDAGEPTIGFNPFTERAMFISYTNALRVTFPEKLETPLPQACDAVWENKSGLITTLNSLDPIMYTDQATGRTFNSQLAGANSLFEYTDDDGDTWIPGQIGLPNGGADHQGVVSGPYPEGFPTAGLLFPNAVYYCSQSVAAAFCARSDDGGQTFGPGTPFKNLDCGAGALHGHPKVAPDGTLYIPDSSQCVASLGLDGSSEKVVAFVSEDAGTTYEVRPLPDSQGGAGSDPSIALATDGTAYMCYENADGTTRVAVSGDKGVTWEHDQDVGAAAGLVATRFPAMIAGDPDRAACAFLGTTTVGADEDLSFEGVWYPYIATTYDGGETWQLVNVSPNDPVQGFGGVGPSGTNRNLLDFNDLELDNLGRPMFAYADGCIGGCVLDPSQNSFAAKGTIVRQSGGRPLYAEFDNLAGQQFNVGAPIPPAAACALQDDSLRTLTQTRVVWREPDNGGSEITNYEVYRAENPAGPYEFVGDAGARNQFIDTTASTSVPEYSYKIVAENTAGSSVDSNIITLPIEDDVIVDTCSLPGDTIILDSEGDSATPDHDIISVSVAEPADFAGNFVVTLKVATFTATEPPPTSFYPVLFPLRDNFYFALNVGEGLPSFEYGTFEELPQGLLAFTAEGDLDERSTYSADGTIVFVVPKTLFGELNAGDIIAGFDVRSRVGSASLPSRDTAGPADYLVRTDLICDGLVGNLLATLAGSRNEGEAPLSVDFTISGQAPDGESLSSYSIQFGDGSFVEDEPFGGQDSVTITHVYNAAGTYRAQASVKDTAGSQSSNLAEHTVVVAEPGTGGSGGGGGSSAGATGGGALGWPLLALLMVVGVLRRQLRGGRRIG